MNAFPSFYQFVRSAVCRYMNLALLYGNDEGLSPYDVPVYGEEELDDFLEEAVSAMLLESSIRWVRILGPLRKDGRQPMCFTGYMGQLVFAGDFSRYMPLLAFMQALGNGNDTVYGLGCYHFEILKYINKKQ